LAEPHLANKWDDNLGYEWTREEFRRIKNGKYEHLRYFENEHLRKIEKAIEEEFAKVKLNERNLVNF